MIKNENVVSDVYNIWDGQDKAFYIENTIKEYTELLGGTLCVFNVVEPTLTIYRPRRKNIGIGVVILPGGGYKAEAIYAEGYDVAKVLSNQGFTSAVLKYRLPNLKTSNQPELVPLSDARQAILLLRHLADKYGIHNKVGILGFSAGSHLATIASLWKTNNAEEIPDFSGLMYGTTNLSDVNLKWLEETLYFRKLTNDELAQNHLPDLVTNESPPAFLVHAYDDTVCKVIETTSYAQELYANNVPVEMHLFSKGGHGFGIGRKKDGTDQWVSLFVNWLKSNIL